LEPPLCVVPNWIIRVYTILVWNTISGSSNLDICVTITITIISITTTTTTTILLLVKAYFDNFPSENESIGLNDPIDKGWLFCFSHFYFCVSFWCDSCFASLFNPGQMADNDTPWLQSVLSVSHNNWYMFIFVQFFALSLFFESLLQFSFENGHHSWKIEKVLSRSASECDYKNLPC
jgi:hypothetical protein